MYEDRKTIRKRNRARKSVLKCRANKKARDKEMSKGKNQQVHFTVEETKNE